MAGERTLPGLGLTGFWNLGSDGWKNAVDSDWRTLSVLTQLTVISRLAVVPGAPSNGDMHILTGAPNAQTVAIYDNGTWVYLTPQKGWTAGVQAESDHVKFDGAAWILLSKFPSLDIAGNIVVGGTVDGRDVAVDGTKLDLVIVTGSVDLDAIDDRVNALGAAVIIMGGWDASSGAFPGGSTAQTGESWLISVAGAVDSIDFSVNDRIIALVDNASATVYAGNWLKADYSDIVTSVVGQTGTVTIQQIITAMNIEKLDRLVFDITAGYPVSEGEVAWNADDGTLDVGVKNGVVLQMGQEMHIHAKAVVNLADGDVVYASGAVGASGKIEVSKFIADDSISQIYMLGVATQAITSGSFGYITVFGSVRGIPTNGAAEAETWVDGTVLYASPTVAGRLTNVIPIAPNQNISVAMVIVSHATNGTLYIRPSRGLHLGELHDVDAPSPSNHDHLKWEINKWVNSPDAVFNSLTVKTNALHVDSGGALLVGTLDKGPAKNGDMVLEGGVFIGGKEPTNSLKMYNEKPWTPVLTDGVNSDATYDLQIGSYTHIGNKIYATGRIKISSLGAISGDLKIGGLPKPATNILNLLSPAVIGKADGLAISAGQSLGGYVDANDTLINLTLFDATTGTTNLQHSEFSATGDIAFSIEYISPFLSIYSAGGYEPAVIFDFASTLGSYGTGYFAMAGVEVSFDALMLHTATGLGTLTDSDGLLKNRAHNLFLNSAVAITQGVSVTSSANYTLAFKGTGSITYSGAAAGTLNGTGANDLVVAEVATTTGTLTCTVTGSVAVCRVYRSDLGGIQNNPDTTSDPTYVVTGGSAVYKRRNNYVNGVRRCLIEPEAATNLLTFSNEFENPAWSKAVTTINDDVLLGPDGNTSASDFLHTASSGSVTDNVAIAADSIITLSTHITKGTTGNHDWHKIQVRDASAANGFEAYFDRITGVIGTTQVIGTGATVLGSTMEDVGNGIYRVSVTGTLAAGITNCQSKLINVTSDNTNTRELTNSAGWSAIQIEEGSVPSSYIPTSGSTVTRAPETLVIPSANMASVVNTTAMSIHLDGFMSYADTGVQSETVLARWRVDANNSIIVDMDTDGAATGKINFNQNAAGTLDTVASAADAYAAGVNVPFNVASRHTSGAINGAVDGTALTEDATPIALADLSSADFQITQKGIHNIGLGRIWGVDITNDGIEEASA